MLWKGGQGERSKGTGKDKAREGEQGKNSVRINLSEAEIIFVLILLLFACLVQADLWAALRFSDGPGPRTLSCYFRGSGQPLPLREPFSERLVSGARTYPHTCI